VGSPTIPVIARVVNPLPWPALSVSSSIASRTGGVRSVARHPLSLPWLCARRISASLLWVIGPYR